MIQFAADIPPSLHEADDILTRYGRWAANTGRGARTCGSAEGAYRPSGAGVLDARREAGAVPLTQMERFSAQRALARVPECERVVLSVLYVPRRQPIGQQFRMLQVPPQMAAERHLVGLGMWWNLYRSQIALTAT